MDVYFIRHGQTDGNVARRHQHQNSELNELGKEQIKRITPLIIDLNPTHLISSTQLRALQTAQIIIEGGLDLIPNTYHAFEELARPANIVGNRYFGLGTIGYMWRWFIDKDQSGGEDYGMFLERIKKARAYLESFEPDSRVVVVSHAIFINLFLRHICKDERMTLWQAAVAVYTVFFMRNATIVHLKYNGPGKGKCSWQILSTDFKQK
ncbi:MAG TPA: histidine phosphatase family protein [Candidatus Paceibacterota bacterium]|nr:histidine phosphatase family protein [Candidatus Paceibacterota bacterium]